MPLAKWLSLEIESIWRLGLTPAAPPYTSSRACKAHRESPLAPAFYRICLHGDLDRSSAPSTPLEYLHQVAYARSSRSAPCQRTRSFSKRTPPSTTSTQLSCLFGLICFQEVDMFLHNQLFRSRQFASLGAALRHMSAFFTSTWCTRRQQDTLYRILNVVVPQMSV